MKIAISLLSLLLVQWAVAAGLHLGDDLKTTLEKLGEPEGSIEMQDRVLMLYPTGRVVLERDAVVEIDLISEAEYAERRARLEQERAEWRLESERRAAARTQEGESIRAAQRGSHAFASRPARDRVDYWRRFQTQYPDVDVSDELARALESYQTELAELRTQQQIAQLQARVAEAEKEATSARLETEKLKREAERERQSQRFGLRHYYDPVVVRPRIYHPQPSTVTIITEGNQRRLIQHERKPPRPDYWQFRSYNPDGTAERVARYLHER